MNEDWSATHQLPPAGANAWAEPDAEAEALPRFDPDEQVEVLEKRGAWARARTRDGREAWLDGRRLQSLPPDASSAQTAEQPTATSTAAPAATSAPAPGAAPEPGNVAFWFWVETPQVIVSGDAERTPVATLQPGNWYQALDQQGEWVEASDGQGRSGWLGANVIRRD